VGSVEFEVPLSPTKPTPKFEGWTVGLKSKSKLITGDESDDLLSTQKTEAVDLVTITFNDEAIARRVAEAFRHAADLCRGKEPF
jgi:hypothetical protein